MYIYIYCTKEGISFLVWNDLCRRESLESFNESLSLPFGLIFKFSRHPNTSCSPETAFPSGIPGGGGWGEVGWLVGWSLRSRNSRGVDTELRFKTRRLPLLVSPLLFSRSATTPSGTRDSAQADQQKRASPCLHLHSRERPSMSLQSMTTLSSSLVSPKGRDDDSGNGGIRFLTLHTHTHTSIYASIPSQRSGKRVDKGKGYCETRSTFSFRREYHSIIVISSKGLKGFEIGRAILVTEAKSRPIFTAINFPKEGRQTRPRCRTLHH